MKLLFFLSLISLSATAQNALPGLGQWREHLPYQNVVNVTASAQKIYAATPYALFSADAQTGEVERFSKVSGLAETGVSALAYDNVANKLIVAYSNSNVDVLTPGGIRNIPDIKRSAISGDKNIYDLYPDGSRCYLSTGLGVVVLDLEKYEVKDSWFIGNGGGYVKINSFVRTPAFYYAATEQGLKRTGTGATNPANYQQWQTVSGTGGLALSAAKQVVLFSGKVVVQQSDSLFIESGGGWAFFFANGNSINTITAGGNQLLVSQKAAGKVVVLNAAGAVQQTIGGNTVLSPQKTIQAGGSYWVADGPGGLRKVTGNAVESFIPDSPQNIVLGAMAVREGVLWAAAGAVNSAWNYQYNPSGLFSYQAGNWQAYNQYNFRSLDTVLDVITVAIDPRDNSAWGGSFGGGLVHITTAGTPVIYKQTSPLLPTVGDPGSYRVAGLAFDEAANLWVANFGSPRQLHVLKAGGTWQSFVAPFGLYQNAAAQIVIDNAGNKWIQSPLGNGILVFNEGDFANPSDDRWKLIRTGSGNTGLPSADVTCLARDKSGFIWAGTADGIAVFQCPEEVFNNGCDAVRPVIKEGTFASYLFKGQEVRSIAVDGADRKWVGTASGLWLIAPDGDAVLANYTDQNSPLLSNDVRSLAIDGRSGEVFVATANGLISFRGSATEYEETKGAVLVFPNPVPPGFAGSIGIRGLPENSVVKIIEPSGRLAYQGRSLGGQAIWNGKDYQGRKAASGVYLVLAADAVKGETVVAKIVVVK